MQHFPPVKIYFLLPQDQLGFMLMAPNYQVQKTWQEELTDTIARTCLFSAEIQNIISDQEAQPQNINHNLL